ncbi:hypothetical protein T484DRAFT_1849087, partial [Baffinella frigidus]
MPNNASLYYCHVSEAVSYDGPVLVPNNASGDWSETEPIRVNLPSTGSMSVTIVGASFGYADNCAVLRFGATACEASDWQSDTSLHCRHPGGLMSSHRLMITAAGGVGTLSESHSYDAPTIRMKGGLGLLNSPSSGGGTITVIGAGFGMFGSSVQ